MERLNKSKPTYLLIFVSIILVDLVTKIVALNILPFQENIFLYQDKISFYLIFNEGSTGEQADYLLQLEPNKNLALIFSSIRGLLLLGYIIFIFDREIRKLYKWLIGVSILIITAIIVDLIKPYFLDVNISNWTASVVGKLAVITVYVTFFRLTKNNLFKIFSTIIIAAGTGNLINHFYYPYQVIDFIHVKGSYELLRIGVFNLADLAYYIGFIGLIVSLIVSFIGRK